MNASVQSETTHKGRLLTVRVLSFTDENGRPVQREVVAHPGAVVILPVLGGDRLILIRNYRIAVDETLWELPAGMLETGEEPQHAAGRELEEETGYRAGRMNALGGFLTSPGFSNELIHAFVAEDLEFVGQRLEAGERIEAVPLPVPEVDAMIADGRIRDAKTIATVLKWQRFFRDRAS